MQFNSLTFEITFLKGIFQRIDSTKFLIPFEKFVTASFLQCTFFSLHLSDQFSLRLLIFFIDAQLSSLGHLHSMWQTLVQFATSRPVTSSVPWVCPASHSSGVRADLCLCRCCASCVTWPDAVEHYPSRISWHEKWWRGWWEPVTSQVK